MSLKVTDTSLGIEVKNAIVKIGYYTVNRTGFSEITGEPIFSANLYLEYSNATEIYFRKCISIDNLALDELNFETFYTKMKDLEEFGKAKDEIPVYEPPIIIPEIIPEDIAPAVETPAEQAPTE